MVGLTNIVNNVLSGAAVARGWEGVDVATRTCDVSYIRKTTKGVSKNRGTSKSSILNRIFHEINHPILGYPSLFLDFHPPGKGSMASSLATAPRFGAKNGPKNEERHERTWEWLLCAIYTFTTVYLKKNMPLFHTRWTQKRQV